MAFRSVVLNVFLFLVGVKANSAPAMNIAEIAVSETELSTLVTALSTAGLVEAVSGDGSDSKITVFAPQNAAFEALETGVLGTLLLPVNLDLLTSLLTYHVAPVEALADSLTLSQQIPTLQTSALNVTSVDPVTINGAGVVTADVMATNGVVHIIDSVLLPPIDFPNKDIVATANGTSILSTLTAAVVAAGLGGALTDASFTVFAPTNDAFAALGADTVSKLLMPENLGILASILLHHVAGTPTLSTGLGSEVQTLNGTFMASALQVNGTDYLCSNGGVIHIINNVLIPSWFSMELLDPVPVDPAPTMDIAQTAVATAELSLLVTALGAADLVSAVSSNPSSETKLTVFAPQNSAFEALPTGVLSTLLLEANKDLLTSVLTYHVAPVEALSTSLSLNQAVATLQGEEVTVTSVSPVMINMANVVTADVMATNGVVHIIDSVLLPTAFSDSFPNKNIVQTVNGTSLLSTLFDAVVATNLGGALSGSNLTVFAPTNAAFSALGSETLTKLLLPANLPILSSILQYHVAGSPIMSSGLGTEVESLNGTFMVSAVKANTTDILCSGNNFIHIINEVLIPSWFSADLLAEDDTAATTTAAPVVETDAASLPCGAPLRTVMALLVAMWAMFH